MTLDSKIEYAIRYLFHNIDPGISEDKTHFQDIDSDDFLFLITKPFDTKSGNHRKTNREFLYYLENHKNTTCHGYCRIVDNDLEIVISGLYCAPVTEKDRADFLLFNLEADILRDNELFLYSRWN